MQLPFLPSTAPVPPHSVQDNNMRYVALNTLSKVVGVDTQVWKGEGVEGDKGCVNDAVYDG